MENVLTINFTEDADAYEGLTNLKELEAQGQIGLEGAAVVLRQEDGAVTIKDEVGDIGYEGAATGGIVGLIVGILGGPIGVLLGGATGVLIGSLFDMDDLDESESVLSEMSREVRVGHPAVVAAVDEQSPEVVDTAMHRLDGKVLRQLLTDVEAEIAAAEEAQRAAKKEARRKLHEERRAERKEKVEEKIAELKSKLRINGAANTDQGKAAESGSRTA
jgi:uncharacterized membrane protein